MPRGNRAFLERLRELEETAARTETNLDETIDHFCDSINRAEMELSQMIKDATAVAAIAATKADKANRRLLAKVQRQEIQIDWLIKQTIRLACHTDFNLDLPECALHANPWSRGCCRG